MLQYKSMNKVKLIKTDTYYNIFPLLIEEMKKISDKNSKIMIFCEEKISLMTERFICSKLNGSFSASILSFGKYLRKRTKFDNVLSKEGSVMVVKRILQTAKLNCFSAGKSNLASTLFELIIQLKSAKILPSDLSSESVNDSILKNKLQDISLVYSEYENYLESAGYFDQNSLLNNLPKVIEEDSSIENAYVFLLGYTGWTKQAREGVKALLNKAKSVTAILTAGENEQIYLNETANSFISICNQQRKNAQEVFEKTDTSFESKIISEKLFKPSAFKGKRESTQKISLYCADSREEEVRNLAMQIKNGVIKEGLRYKDFAVAIPEFASYEDLIEGYFSKYEIPYFSDSKKKAENHPIVSLILSYIEIFRKGFDRRLLSKFYKNPLFSQDKDFTDKFQNYLLKYNINYNGIKKPFKYFSKEEELDFESFRKKICSCFEKFDIYGLLINLNVQEKTNKLGEELLAKKETELYAINKQVYDAVLGIINELNLILGDLELNKEYYRDIESMFLSGVSALELSILPQYNDAVFVGGYRETALALSKKLFMVGLDSSVPAVKEDVALLSDRDINKLSEIKVLVEPKIKIVNERAKENFALASLSFEQELITSYPITIDGNKQTRPSELIYYLENLFTIKKYNLNGGRIFYQGGETQNTSRYLTPKMAMLSFAEDCGKFAEGDINSIDEYGESNSYDFASYYSSTEGRKERLEADYILEQSNKEIKLRLNGDNVSVIGNYISPTILETFHTCPYRAFVSNVLNVYERENGVVSSLSIGNLLHEVFEKYLKGYSVVIDEESSEKLIERCIEEVLEDDAYKKFLEEKDSEYAINSALKEARNFCQQTYKMFTNSDFRPYKTEAVIGMGKDADFPPVKLADDVNLIGKIDRVDTYKDYFRVLDYKTGSVDTDDSSLFVGKRLQLYLYASAVKNSKLAGVYYLPIIDEYKKEGSTKSPMALGHSLDSEEAILAQDYSIKEKKSDYIQAQYQVTNKCFKNVLSEKSMQAYIDYALKIGKNATEEMKSGVIVPSPYSNICKYCKFVGLCGGSVGTRPEIKISNGLIEESVEENSNEE